MLSPNRGRTRRRPKDLRTARDVQRDNIRTVSNTPEIASEAAIASTTERIRLRRFLVAVALEADALSPYASRRHREIYNSVGARRCLRYSKNNSKSCLRSAGVIASSRWIAGFSLSGRSADHTLFDIAITLTRSIEGKAARICWPQIGFEMLPLFAIMVNFGLTPIWG
jgi:hypothetical protein